MAARSAFYRYFRTELSGVGGCGTWRVRGRRPRGSWPGRQEAANQTAEQIGFGAGSGEGDAYPRGDFGDARGDLDQAHAQSGELGCGERLRAGDGVTDGQQQPVGGGVQHEPHLVGERRAATGAVGGKLSLVQLDKVLGLTAGTV